VQAAVEALDARQMRIDDLAAVAQSAPQQGGQFGQRQIGEIHFLSSAEGVLDLRRF
jgi:hypothetical protein